VSNPRRAGVSTAQMRCRLAGVVVVAGLIGCGGARIDRVQAVLSGLRSPVAIEGAAPRRYALADRMKRYAVPGVSIAVADGDRVVWARGFGVGVAGAGAVVDATTLFPGSSISKAVTATATLRLVDERRLALDTDVNGYLRSWKVPDNDLTASAKVTLRRLLSHSAGTNVHAWKSYALDEAIPTLTQILDGVAPANTEPVRVEAVPGTGFRYSGGGVEIEQLVLEDTTGERFDALMQRLVLAPIGMRDSWFAAGLPLALRARAATAHDGDGAPIADRVHPELAADGLWTTPTDLLRWAIEIAAARAGRSQRVLTRATATAMLTVQQAPVGLGPFLDGTGRGFRFGHQGSDDGYHAEIVYFPQTGQGAAIMTNGAGGQLLIRELLFAIAAEYGWPDYSPETVAAFAADAATLDRLVGVYEAPYDSLTVTITVTRAAAGLVVAVPVLGIRSDAVLTSPTSLVLLDSGDSLAIVGAVTALRFGPLELPRRLQ